MVWLAPRGAVCTHAAQDAAADGFASRGRNAESLADDLGVGKLLFGQLAVGLQDHADGVFQISPSLLQGRALVVGTGELRDERDVPVRNLPEDSRKLVVHPRAS